MCRRLSAGNLNYQKGSVVAQQGLQEGIDRSSSMFWPSCENPVEVKDQEVLHAQTDL